MSSDKDMKDVNICYGDIVSYTITPVNFDVDPNFDSAPSYSICRVHGMLTADRASNIWGNGDGTDIYIVATVDEPLDDMKEVISFVSQIIPDDICDDDLEWGSIPEKNWVVATLDEIDNFVNESMKKTFKKQGLCPRCGDDGEWKNFALLCRWHGMFL